MGADGLLLGPVLFQAFEVPAWVRFGGRQRLAVHPLPGGGRVVDALGADEGDLVWSGAFSGVDAGLRAQTLDELRRVGLPLLCAWGSWAYQVVIKEFEAQMAGPWWVPYRLRLLVLYDISRLPVAVDLALDGVNDIAQAAALGASPGLGVDAALAGAAVGLAADPVTALAAAGSVAQLAAARGYLLRAGG
jgi:hypothetical protein